jgi:hypothetical protein
MESEMSGSFSQLSISRHHSDAESPVGQTLEVTMTRKKMLVAMTAVALGIAGAISTAHAGNDKDPINDRGGIKIGPLGQRFGGPPARGYFAFAPLRHVRVHGRHYRYYY